MEQNINSIVICMDDNQRNLLLSIIEFYQINQSFPDGGKLVDEVADIFWIVQQAA